MKVQFICALFSILLFSFGINYSNGDLDIKKVEEGNCSGIEDHRPGQVDFKFVSHMLIFCYENCTEYPVPRTWYISVASQHCYLTYAEAYLGRPVQDPAELSKMCLKIAGKPYNASSLEGITQGYGKNITQICSPVLSSMQKGLVEEKCVVTDATPGVATSAFDDWRDFIVLTDNKSYVVMVICKDGVKMYKIITVTPDIPDEIYMKIEQKITAMGFNPGLIQKMVCKEVNGKLRIITSKKTK